MKKLIALIMAGMMLLSSCGASNETTAEGESGESNVKSDLDELSFVYSKEEPSHNYLADALSTITAFTYTTVDALVGYDNFGRTRPLLATSYEVSEDGLTWTFKIREGVKWYTYEMEEYADVTAHDFVAGVKYVLTKSNASKMSNLIYDTLENAKAYYEGEITDFEQVGVKAIDDYTLQYKLAQPAPYFLGFLSYGCWYPVNQAFLDTLDGPEMFGTSNDTMLYCGPYVNTIWEHETRKVRELNPNYWDAANYSVGTITNIYNKQADTLGPDLFLRNEISTVTIGASVADEWVNDESKKAVLSYAPVNSTSWQYFINFDPQYGEEYRPEEWKLCANNINFRKALTHATDIERVVKAIYPYTWKGVISSTPTLKGMFSVDGADYTEQPGLANYKPGANFDLDLAKEFKAKAMEELKDKVQFPIPLVYPHSTNQGQIDRAVIFEQMMEANLGTDFIDVVLVSYPPTGFMSKVVGAGYYSYTLNGWGPDYADPSSTLEMYSDNPGAGAICGKAWMSEDWAPIKAKLDEAQNELLDMNNRLKLFAEAEAMILDGAYSQPAYCSGGGLMATYVDPFSPDCTQFGRNLNKLNRIKVLEKPLGLEEYDAALAKWEADKAEAMKNPNANWENN